MRTLDCHDVESTFTSLEVIFGLSREELTHFIDNCDPMPNNIDVDKWPGYALSQLVDLEGANTKYESTYWFHLTRGPEDSNFSKLRPLSQALPELLEQLADMFRDRVDERAWETFERRVLEDEIEVPNLDLRRKSKEQQGPFGWLICDYPFQNSNVRDYSSKPPEAVEDLIGVISGRFGLSFGELIEEYISNTYAYIVKFETDDASTKNLAAALYYLICNKKSIDLTFNCAVSCSMKSSIVSSVNTERYPETPPF